jgi:hypothetical protein
MVTKARLAPLRRSRMGRRRGTGARMRHTKPKKISLHLYCVCRRGGATPKAPSAPLCRRSQDRRRSIGSKSVRMRSKLCAPAARSCGNRRSVSIAPPLGRTRDRRPPGERHDMHFARGIVTQLRQDAGNAAWRAQRIEPGRRWSSRQDWRAVLQDFSGTMLATLSAKNAAV